MQRVLEVGDMLADIELGTSIREVMEQIANALMDAEAAAMVNAAPYERSGARTAYRNGYRTREWVTEYGTLSLHIPKLRRGTYYPAFLEDDIRGADWLASVAMAALFGDLEEVDPGAFVREVDIQSDLPALLDDVAAAFLSQGLRGVFPKLVVRTTEAGGYAVVGEREDGSRELLALWDGEDSLVRWRLAVSRLVRRGLRGVLDVEADDTPPALWRALRERFAMGYRTTMALGRPLTVRVPVDGEGPRLLLDINANGVLETQLTAENLTALRRFAARQDDAVGTPLLDVA
jgi:hypothetical protein